MSIEGADRKVASMCEKRLLELSRPEAIVFSKLSTNETHSGPVFITTSIIPDLPRPTASTISSEREHKENSMSTKVELGSPFLTNTLLLYK